MATAERTCYAGFVELLKSLCLKEFPCGYGTWRNPNDKYADGQYSITMKDYGIQYEKMEVLEEYLKSGTWDTDTSWSLESSKLRTLAVSEPWKMESGRKRESGSKGESGRKGGKFVHEFFKTLRIIDKQITVVDSNMLKLKNLQVLTLSVNKLESVASENLPASLISLELCTNYLKTVESLCHNPPPLQHLGLSYNLLHSIDEYKYFSVEYWPSLMSLDLSYNNLVGLVDLVEHLSTLPSLRNLILQGNPLSLIPGYRGHVVDALRELTILDDVNISADEKHHFKGLGKKKELILDEAQMVVTMDELTGILMPDELKEDEERPEFPVISTHFVVQYQMLKDCFPKRIETETPEEVFTRNETTNESNRPTESTTNQLTTENVAQQNGVVQQTEVAQQTEVVQHSSDDKDWDESEISMEYRKLHIVDDLASLRDFCLRGIKFTVLSKKTLHWPITPTEEGATNTPETPNKKSAKGGKETPSKKGKETAKTKGGKNEKEKAKKKSTSGKDSGSDMRSDPPVYTEIGSHVVPLETFLEGDRVFHVSCHCGGGPMPAVGQLKESPAVEQPLPKSVKQKERGASPGGKSKPGSASKKKEAKKVTVADDNDDSEPSIPPPVVVNVTVELRRWQTAADCLRMND